MHTMNTVTCLLQNTTLNDVPRSSNDTKSLLQMDAHLFKQWDSEGTRAALFPGCRCHMEKPRVRGQCGGLASGETPNRSSNGENCVWFALCGSRWCCCQPAGGQLTTSALTWLSVLWWWTKCIWIIPAGTHSQHMLWHFWNWLVEPQVELTLGLLSSCYLS